MKKIMFILYSLIFILFSFICIYLYGTLEGTYFIPFHNVFQINDIPMFHDISREEVISKIEQISKEEKVNIYQIQYSSDENGIDNRVCYCSIGDESLFLKKFNTINSEVPLFDPSYKVTTLPMSESLNFKGFWTYIESNNITRLNSTLARFNIKNITLSKSYMNRYMVYNLLRVISMSGIITPIIILFLLLISANTCFIIFKYKDIAIEKLYGYSNFKILISLLNSNLKIKLYAFGISIVFQCIYLYFYNFYVNFNKYILFFIILAILFNLILSIFTFISILMTNFIKIHDMIKNKLPILFLQINNLFFKIVFSIFIILFFCNNIQDLSTLNAKMENNYYWDMLKSYYNLSYGGYNDNYQNMSSISKKLFNILDNKQGILIHPAYTNYYDNPISPYYGNVIFVNKNYLKLQPVIDLYGNELDIDKITDSSEIILVPQKYKVNEKDIIKLYNDYYNFNKYDILKDNNIVKEEIIYIEDNQKFFLFNPSYSPQTNNYAIDPLIVIVDSKSFSDSWYLEVMSQFDFKAYINYETYTINDLEKDIEYLNARNIIHPILSYGSDIAEYIIDLKDNITKNMVLNFLCISIEIFVLSFFVIIYMEKNKKCNFIKAINGYDFYSIHNNFLIILFLTQLISILFSLFYLKLLIKGFGIFILLYIIFEFTYSIFLILYINRFNVSNILKNS